jgi:hypothetical protein
MTTNPLTVRLTDGQTMKSTHTAILDIPQLSKAAKAAHIFPAMENNSLLSVGQLCDEGYYVLFSIDEVTTLNAAQNILMKGSRDLTTGLWRINCVKTNPAATWPQKRLIPIHSIMFTPNVIQEYKSTIYTRPCLAVPSLLSSMQ